MPGERQPRGASSLSAVRSRGWHHADQRAANILPVIETIIAGGITTYKGIAEALNTRRIQTARGGRWDATTVRRIVLRHGRVEVRGSNRSRAASEGED